MSNKYTFEETAPKFKLKNTSNKRKPRLSRNSSSGDDDGTGSLTYSATSSVTGESTDSSFGDIMKVLENQGDSKELASFLKKHAHRGDEKSIAADSLAYSAKSATSDSLAYSADGESHVRSLATDGGSLVSHLQGTALLSAGQHSDQSGYDGGGSAMGASYLNNGGGQRHDVGDEDNIFMMFSPAEHADSMKRRKEKKRRERRAAVEQAKPGSRGSNSSAARPNASAPSTQATSQALRPGSITPTTHNIRDSEPANSAHYSPMAQSSSPRGATYESRQGPPSPVRPTEDDHYRSESKCNREYENNEIPADDDDVWYTKWWMFCFHTAIRNVNPKL